MVNRIKLLRTLEKTIEFFLMILVYLVIVYIYSRVNQWELNHVVNMILVDSWFMVIVIVLFYSLLRFYNCTAIMQSFVKTLIKLVITTIITYIVTSIILLIFTINHISQMMLFNELVLLFFIILLYKYLFGYFVNKNMFINLMLIGKQKEVVKLASKIIKSQPKYFHIKYLLYETNDISTNTELLYAKMAEVDEIYLTKNLSNVIKNIIITRCFDVNQSFTIVPELYELTIARSKTDQIDDILVYRVGTLGLTLMQRAAKRTFDMIISLVALTISTPFMIMIAISLKIENPGVPVLFKQERITRNNKKFELIKFRTMINNAELETGPILSCINDARVTKVGKVLRKTRLDEIPQFWNILKGQMSFVGPRPEREIFVKQFLLENPNYRYRMKVKAGLTGLAQSLGKYDSDFNDKLSFDLYYIATYTFLSDMRIILYTIKAILDGTTEIEFKNNIKVEDILNTDELKMVRLDTPIDLYQINFRDKDTSNE